MFLQGSEVNAQNATNRKLLRFASADELATNSEGRNQYVLGVSSRGLHSASGGYFSSASSCRGVVSGRYPGCCLDGRSIAETAFSTPLRATELARAYHSAAASMYVGE